MPLGLLCQDVCAEILCEANAKDLKERYEGD